MFEKFVLPVALLAAGGLFVVFIAATAPTPVRAGTSASGRANPCAGVRPNPCAAAPANPCAARPANPCAAR